MAEMVNSDDKLLSTEDIIQKAVMNIRSPYSYDQVYKSIAEELQQPGTNSFVKAILYLLSITIMVE